MASSLTPLPCCQLFCRVVGPHSRRVGAVVAWVERLAHLLQVEVSHRGVPGRMTMTNLLRAPNRHKKSWEQFGIRRCARLVVMTHPDPRILMGVLQLVRRTPLVGVEARVALRVGRSHLARDA